MTLNEWINRDKLLESKNVGIIYHFTSVNQFEKIIKNNFNMISNNYVFSCTRNARLSENPNGDISKKKGYVVRINIDGNKLSDKYKIKPFLGYTLPINPLIKQSEFKEKVPRDWGENEEIVYSVKKNRDNTEYIFKSIKLKPYIKSITVSPVDIEDYNKLKNIEKQINIPIEYVKKFTPLKESFMFYDKYDSPELQITG